MNDYAEIAELILEFTIRKI